MSPEKGVGQGHKHLKRGSSVTVQNVRDTRFAVLLRIFWFEMGQEFQFGKHQGISINPSFAGQGIYPPMCLLHKKRILPAQLLKEKITYGKNRAKETEILFKSMSLRQISSTRICNKEIVWGSVSAHKKSVWTSIRVQS